MFKDSFIPNSAFLDFEFNGTNSPDLNLVCCSVLDNTTNISEKFWLHKDKKEYKRLADHLKKFKVLMGFATAAEARSVLALGVDCLGWAWIDLYVEYRMLANHNDDINWGKQLVDGKVKNTFKPKKKWELKKGEEPAASFKPKFSLAEATYKLTGEIRDTEHKDKMRDLIISTPDFFTPEEQTAIMNYCDEDVIYLPKMWDALVKKMLELCDISFTEYVKEAKLRGRYTAHTAWMEKRGYPVDVKAVTNFSKSTLAILYDCQKDINEQFKENPPFKWSKPNQRYSLSESVCREFIEKHHAGMGWDLTDTKKYSLSLEAWQKFYDFKHDYPRGNFGAQMVRYLKLKQALNGFVPSADKTKKTFFDSLGPDGRVRPYMGIFGSQSSRSQPAATGFLFLRPAWMRSMCKPVKGRVCGSIDYGSQEFLISALVSECQGMIDAYKTGDVYLQFAKDAGMAPPNATKKTHKYERDLAKACVLGLSYLLTKYGLAIDLSIKTGRLWTPDEAQVLIDAFYEAYPELKEWQENIVVQYHDNGGLVLPCGWAMFGDNDNFRSVTNFGIQGRGASIMRRAVELAHKRGLEVIFTLHDAIYIEFDYGDFQAMQVLEECMKEAFVYFFPDQKEDASIIRLDPYMWGPDFSGDGEHTLKNGTKVPYSDIYLDERAEAEYERFKKYFEDRDEDLI